MVTGAGVESQKQSIATAESPGTASAPSLPDLLGSFLRLGLVSFGGPAMVVYIKTLAVERKAWLSDAQFKSGVALCQAIPGATAMQCAAYVGWKTRGLPGAVTSYLGFGVPAFVLMLALSIAYKRFSVMPASTSTLTGLQVIVVALVANAAVSFARSSVKRVADGLFAAATAGLFLAGVSPLLSVFIAGAAGTLVFRRAVQVVNRQPSARLRAVDAVAPALVVVAVGFAVVAVSLVADRPLGLLGLVMMKVDCAAFGGGFASVPLMFREVVEARGWMPARSFMDGIALGQITPGPIVITSTFVGYHVAGMPGALVATVSIFTPSLGVLLLAEPWFDRLQASALFRAGVRGASLSFVGLLLSVTIQFGLAAPWNARSILIGAAALGALLYKVNVLWVVPVGAVVSALVL